jgi:hypothetical protein
LNSSRDTVHYISKQAGYIIVRILQYPTFIGSKQKGYTGICKMDAKKNVT